MNNIFAENFAPHRRRRMKYRHEEASGGKKFLYEDKNFISCGRLLLVCVMFYLFLFSVSHSLAQRWANYVISDDFVIRKLYDDPQVSFMRRSKSCQKVFKFKRLWDGWPALPTHDVPGWERSCLFGCFFLWFPLLQFISETIAFRDTTKRGSINSFLCPKPFQ